jgi:hypothetical protein
MVLQDDMLAELKPSIHRIIKKQLGFSEETLLSESLTSLQHGADKDELTRKFFLLLLFSEAILEKPSRNFFTIGLSVY